jgi:hypothetical protein
MWLVYWQGPSEAADYPAVGDVRLGVAYAFGTLVGTLVAGLRNFVVGNRPR